MKQSEGSSADCTVFTALWAASERFNNNIFQTTSIGDGPVDAVFKAVKELFPNDSSLQLYQVHAVTEGTDAQATVSVRLEENGKIATGQSSDTDTVVASAKAYINALNKLLLRREKKAPNKGPKTVPAPPITTIATKTIE